MKRYGFYLLVILFSFMAGYQILNLWRSEILSRKGVLKEDLLKAIRLDPDNSEAFHKLGLLTQWNLLEVDLTEADHYLRNAIARNPLEQEYWLSLAKVFLRTGKADEFEHALESAILVFPSGYRGRWITGNLLLQCGHLEKSIAHFSYILSHYPNQSSFVYDVWKRVVDDPDFVLEKLVPRDPSALAQYLAYLYEAGDNELVKKVWAKRVSLGYKPDVNDILRHIEFLISHGELNEAFKVWQAKAREEGAPVPGNGNLIVNGGFERKKILGGGFDWRMGTVPGAEISFDQSVASEGRNSLKIAFNGRENVDFAHVYQYVSWKPNTDYLLKARIKTQGVTTKNGVKIEVTSIGPAFHVASEPVNGDNAWTELAVAFRSPANSQGGVVRFRREQSNKFDRLISGVVWIDDVQLIEKNSH